MVGKIIEYFRSNFAQHEKLPFPNIGRVLQLPCPPGPIRNSYGTGGCCCYRGYDRYVLAAVVGYRTLTDFAVVRIITDRARS